MTTNTDKAFEFYLNFSATIYDQNLKELLLQ
jgi:hypothetical protein